MKTDRRVACTRYARYTTTELITVESNTDETLSIPRGFQSDGYTAAPELADPIPALAHDCAYTVHMWDSGREITRLQADELLKHLMSISKSRLTRALAPLYYKCVREFGAYAWSVEKPFATRSPDAISRKASRNG